MDAGETWQEGTLEGRTLLLSGGSRGIGLAIALRAARDGANVAFLAKTAEPHPRLEGTVFTAAAAIEAAGGEALPIVGDVRDDAAVLEAVERTVERFGGIDICIHNASAIDLSGTEDVSMKRYDLMQDVNTRGTFLLSKACLPHLRRSAHAQILALAPPLEVSPAWFGRSLAYTLSKYGMSLCVLGLAEELRDHGVSVNALWPRTLIATAAVANVLGGEALTARARRPEIVADAAHLILTRPAGTVTGQFLSDEEVLARAGRTDLDHYADAPAEALAPDLFVGAP